MGIVIRPPLDAQSLLNLTTSLNASIQIREKPEKAEELVLFGTSGASRLAVQGLGIKWFVAEQQGKLDLGVQAEIQTVRLVIDGNDADGFLQKVLSGVHVKAEANAAFGMTLLTGFTFSGGAQLALEIPAHIELGPVTIQSLRLALAPASDRIRLDAGAVFKFGLGPLQVVVQDVGLRTDLEFHPGNIGPANLDIGFKPPTGAGVRIDSPFVTGGGFLFFDSDKGQYGGVLQLDVKGITVTAIGLIATRLPNGAKGFSFVVIITAQGFNPIPVGPGFLAYQNRRSAGDQSHLRSGISARRTKEQHAQRSALPQRSDWQRSADLRHAEQSVSGPGGQLSFGPVVQICWGTACVC